MINPDIEAEMAAWVGLSDVKRQLEALATQIEANTARTAAGLRTSRTTEHLVFRGPPGTGKTSVARVVARLYSSLGALPTSKVVEADRATLVGQFLGSTAIKTNAVVDSALGGVLFIDEAYSLHQTGLANGDAFGGEAVSTLLKRMEDDRDNIVVIVAGYADLIEDFLRSNEGLASRFSSRIDFPSYTAEELLQIAQRAADETDSDFGSGVSQLLREFFSRVVAGGDNDKLGNGRLARNILERCTRERDYRLFKDKAKGHSRADLRTIVSVDAQSALWAFAREHRPKSFEPTNDDQGGYHWLDYDRDELVEQYRAQQATRRTQRLKMQLASMHVQNFDEPNQQHSEVFRLDDGTLKHKWFVNGWTAWTDMALMDERRGLELAAGSHDGWADLFVVLEDGELLHRYWGPHDGWSAWEHWAWNAESVSVHSAGSGHIEVFWTSAGQTLHRWFGRDGWSVEHSFN